MVPSGREPPRSNHLVALDGIRGVAILLVLCLHFSNYDGLPTPTVFVDRMVEMVAGVGWVGVDLFFVLSGFLITGILYDSKSSDHYFRNFYARRVLRICPVYFVALTVFLVVLPDLVPEHPGLRALQGDAFWYWAYLTNIRIAHSGFPAFGALGHFWSLAVEEQFYLLWPVVVVVCGRAKLSWICLVCIGGALLARIALLAAGYGTAAYVLMPSRMDGLAVGAGLALIARGPTGLAPLVRPARILAGLLGAALLATFVWRGGLHPWDPLIGSIGCTALALLFGAILVLAVTARDRTVPGRLWSSPTLCFFGRYSYGLYVFHHPVLFFNLGGLVFLDHVPLVFGSLLLKKLVFVASATVCAVGLALISWHLYEKRFLSLKRLFTSPSSAAMRPAPVAVGRPDLRCSD